MKSNILFLLYVVAVFLHGFLTKNDPPAETEAIVPIIMGAVAAGAAIAKGIKKRRAAKRRARQAAKLEAEGKAEEANAWKNRTDFETPQELVTAKNTALNQFNSNATEENMQANADLGAGNVLSQVKRSASTSGQAMAGALAAEQMRQGGYRDAAVVGAQERSAELGQVMSAYDAIAASKERGYQYNVLMPFGLKYERAIGKQNAGLQGKITADNMKVEAFGDMMNALSSTASTIGNAYGSGSGFDMKGMFNKAGK
jgi:hypothetical protein